MQIAKGVLILILMAPLLSLGTQVSAAEISHPDLGTEALYSEALIAYSKQKNDDAIQLLNRALKGEPNHLEALELKALILKSKGEDAGAVDLYRKLIQLRPERETAPYQFELGVLQYRQKNADEARALFLKSIERKFNVGASHFFLGLMDYEAEDMDAAEAHFTSASEDHEPELKMAGTFYLGLLQIRTGNAQRGADLLAQAREQAVQIKDTAGAPEVRQATDRMLAPFDRGKFFANASFLPMYDNNVALTPVIGFAPTGTQSIKALISAGGGYITSPMKANQFVYSLRASTNVNTAKQALPYQFLSLSPAVNWNSHPLARNRFGAWFSLEHTLQYVKDAGGTWTYSFDQSYSTIPTLGMNFTSQLTQELQVKAHALIRHADYKASGYFSNSYNNNSNGITPRFLPSAWEYSGDLHEFRVSAQLENGMQWLNPSVWSALDWYNAKGTVARYGAWVVGASNTARFNRQHTLNASLEATGTRYFETDRSDGTLLIHLNHVWQVTSHWSFMADATYTVNTSSWGELSYNRYTGGVGMGWSL